MSSITMPITRARYVRELHGACFCVTITSAILSLIYSSNRGFVQLTFTQNNTRIVETPRHFDVGFVFFGMLAFSSIWHAFAVFRSNTVSESIFKRTTNNRAFYHLLVVLPALITASVIGIGNTTDIFALHASGAFGLLLAVIGWICTLPTVGTFLKIFLGLYGLTQFLIFWVFVYVNSQENAVQIILFVIMLVMVLFICSAMYRSASNAILQSSIKTLAILGLELSCTSMWVLINQASITATIGPQIAFWVVVIVYTGLLLFVFLRIDGQFLHRVNENSDDAELDEKLLCDSSIIDETETSMSTCHIDSDVGSEVSFGEAAEDNTTQTEI